MNALKRKLLEDRAMRDAAKSVIGADLDFIKADVERQGIASRITETAKDRTKTMAAGALDLAEENKGSVTAGAAFALAGIAAWIYRKPIMDLVDGLVADLLGEVEPEEADSMAEPEALRQVSESDENMHDGDVP